MDLLDDESVALRPTTAWIDLGALRHNVERVRARVGTRRIIAIVKANAYGHGLVRTAKELLGFGADALGVAFLEEGIALRKAGVRAPILVLGGIIGNQVRHFLEHDLELTASSLFKLGQIEEAACAMGRRARVHLKIDTGMERIGIHWDHAERLFEAALRSPHAEVAGVFSHLATADTADPKGVAFARLQAERFEAALDWYRKRSLPVPMRHLASSGAILQHPDLLYDAVRPGIMLYGVYPTRDVPRAIPLRAALSLVTRVVYFKVVRGGAPVGYGGTWTARADTRVVTLPVGYGDGYSRGLSGKGEVLIRGTRYPIAGTIAMDALMVDIGQDSAFNGDEAVLIGAQGSGAISCEELADRLGTIPYEVLTSINTRVPRRYVEHVAHGEHGEHGEQAR